MRSFSLRLLAPSLPPQNIRGHNISSSSIKVYWDPVPEANRHGIIREYHFYIYPLQSSDSSFDDVNTTGDLYKTFTGLEPYWNYSIQMAAKTVELGNYSVPIFVMTGEAGEEYCFIIILWFLFSRLFNCYWVCALPFSKTKVILTRDTAQKAKYSDLN